MTAPITNATDLVLIRELQRDARQTNRALAETAGLAPSTSLGRVRDLEERGVFTGFHGHVDLAALGRPLQALVFVRLRPKSAEIVSRFQDHIWALPETIGLSLITGQEDLVIHLAVSDADALQRVILNEVSSFPGVFDERTSLLFEHRRKAVIAAADIARRLHAGGLVHKDLYLCHLFVAKGGDEVTLIDLARVTKTRSRRLRVKDLAALLHSAKNLCSRADLWRGLKRYGGDKRLARAVIRKERR
ncbi:MAG: lipopolysaccharide kinase InaA family protein, partial [Actinomycetota bacterium]